MKVSAFLKFSKGYRLF